MKRFTKSIVLAAVGYLIASHGSTFAQSRSRNNGASHNNGNARGGFSAGQQVSGGFRGLPSSGSGPGSGRQFPSGSISSNAGGRIFQSGNNRMPFAESGIKSGPNGFPGSSRITGRTSEIPSSPLPNPADSVQDSLKQKGAITSGINRTPSVAQPWTLKPGTGGAIPVPFFPKSSGGNGVSGNGNSGTNPQTSSGQSATGGNKTNWQRALQHVLAHNKHHWCHTRPSTCHWWTQYCEPISHCHVNEIIICNWNRVQCPVVVGVGLPVEDVQWYLGLKGILLPGKGIGIDAVDPNSPAAMIGLQPGMVITVCNGIAMVDETSMHEAIRISGGVLKMTLLSTDGSQVLEGVAVMIRLSAVSY